MKIQEALLRATLASLTLPSLLPFEALARQVNDAGFSVTIPDDWKVQNAGQGYVTASSPDGSRIVFVRPLLGRQADCGTLLRDSSSPVWTAFPGARTVAVNLVPQSRNLQVARFSFRQGSARGEILCAETSSRTAMYYGIGAPSAAFQNELASLTGILRSFRYGAGAGTAAGRGGPSASAPAPPPLVTWQEPNEHAYTIGIPQGWRVGGGLHRLDVSHWTSGIDATSPEGSSTIRMGDQRLRQCQVPGPGFLGTGREPGFCPYQSARQAGESYLRQTMARDWELNNLQVVSLVDRTDLAAEADRLPRQQGLDIRTTSLEAHFSATRRGMPAEGLLLMSTSIVAAAQGQNFIQGSLTTNATGLVGPAGSSPALAATLGAMVASTRWNIEWWRLDQRISTEVARQNLAAMQASAENQQRAFWDRMAASDRRNEAVRDVLGGTVRLSDGQGNTYQTQAGSNYYFYDTDAARRASNPGDAVVGTDVYPSPLVDLRPLEVIP